VVSLRILAVTISQWFVICLWHSDL